MKYATPSTYQTSPAHQTRRREKVSTKPSETKPNEGLSLQEMFRKFSTGQPIPTTQHEPIWNENATHDDPDYEKLKNADLIDKQEYAEALGERMKEMDKTIKLNEQLAEKKREEDEEKAFDAKLAKRQKKSDTEKKDTDGVTPH